MKQFFLMAACILITTIAANAQSNTINFDNATGHTVYITLTYTKGGCSGTKQYVDYVVPTGTSTAIAGITPGVMALNPTDEFIAAIVYTAPGGGCGSPVSVNACTGSVNATLTTYTTMSCSGAYFTNVFWDNSNSPTSVDIKFL